MNDTLNVTDNATIAGDFDNSRYHFPLLFILMIATPVVHLMLSCKSLLRFCFTVIGGTLSFVFLAAMINGDKNERGQSGGLTGLTIAYISGALYGIFIDMVYQARLARQAARAQQPITSPTDQTSTQITPDAEDPSIALLQTPAPAQLPQFDTERQSQPKPLAADATDNAPSRRGARTTSPTHAGEARRLEWG